MKKQILTIAIILGFGLTTFAEGDYKYQGGLFQRGAEPREYTNRDVYSPLLLPDHGSDQDQGAAPLGSGIALLAGLGAAYLVGKKRNNK